MALDYLAQLLRHGRIDPVEYYVNDTNRAVYVENAKVACTAIKAAMFPAKAAAHPDQASFHEEVRAFASHHLPERARDYLVFTFVRHPETRLQSCYRDKIQRRAGEQGNSILQRRFHRGLFSVFGGVDIRGGNLPFDRFAQAVARIPDRVSDRHFASQARVVDAVQAAPISFIGRLEHLQQDWDIIQSRTGLPPLSQLNTSAANAAGRRRNEPCSDAARSAIAQRYSRDFSMLGYGHE